MTTPPSSRPAVPGIDAATHLELRSLVASARVSAGTSRRRQLGGAIAVVDQHRSDRHCMGNLPTGTCNTRRVERGWPTASGIEYGYQAY